MVDKVFVSLRPRLVLIRLVVFVMLLEADFGPLACRLARMSLTIMSTRCTSAILWTVFRALDTGSRRLLVWPRLLVFLDPQKKEMPVNGQVLDFGTRRLLDWPRLLFLLVLVLQKRELLFNEQARLRMRRQVRASESLDCASLIVHFSNARLPTIREFMVSHLVSVLARCLALLLVFLLLLGVRPMCRALPSSAVPCMSLDNSPSHVANNSSSGFRVPRARSVPKVGFPVRPKTCALPQRWRLGLIFGRPAVYGGRLQVHSLDGNQPQVPGQVVVVW